MKIPFINFPLTSRAKINHFADVGKMVDLGKQIMTIKETKLAGEGALYWNQYVKLNGYAFRANKTGLRVLSKNTGIKISHLRKCINIYLEA